MPETQLTAPTGTEGEAWGLGNLIVEAQYDPSVTATTTLANGTVVSITSGYTVGTGVVTSVGAAAYPVIRASTTTPSFLTLGVVINAPKGGYVPGAIVQVLVKGVGQVLCDANNTTYGNLLITGSTTAGAATNSATATLGKTIGVCLQTLTISSGTALVYALVGVY